MNTAAVRFCLAKSFELPWNRFATKWIGNSTNYLWCAAAEQNRGTNRRNVSFTRINYKKRKTDEDKELAKNNDQQLGKKLKNKIVTFGVVDIWRNMTVSELAKSLGKDLEHVQEVMLYVKGADHLLDPGTILVDLKMIREISMKCGLKTRVVAAPTKKESETEIKDKDIFAREPAASELLKPRAPVVTVMGHVDHGKTTLLDTLRGASVAAGEAGGITQHIGAFTVELENGDFVTFLDTPGHAAFSAMRARGANCTDIIVLVVAADDGVMEQTKEVIKLATDANVPIIVAANKIDKPDSDIERTKRGLLQMGIALEGYGGDVQLVGISALHGTNLQELADAISTQATMMNLSADCTGFVEGVVVESKLDTRRGKLSTAIVTRGTLRKGAILVSGQAHAKVRGLFDHVGQPIEQALPGTPVEILGWRELPLAGDQILEVESEKKANSVLRFRQNQSLQQKGVQDLEAIQSKIDQHNSEYLTQREKRRLGMYRNRSGIRPKESAPDEPTPRVNLIIKGDVHGSVEAILDVLDTYNSNDKCRVDVVHYGVGEISDGDFELAKLFKAIIYAFSIKSPPKVPKGVVVREVNIIYRLVDDLIEEINKKLPPVEVEEVLGEANVLQIFSITEGRKEVKVMGCRCVKGVLKKNAKFRLIRQQNDNEVICDGALESMRHLKNEVDSIKRDVECGLRLQDQDAVPETGDLLVCYTTKTEVQKTDWDTGF